MDVNENASCLNDYGYRTFFASKLAPTKCFMTLAQTHKHLAGRAILPIAGHGRIKG
ncbi:transposase [Pseudomonas sp. IT-P74]|uniref:Uncharacterized protein n=1 Tax=Pseudomonas fluorescens TaxID=294 RepID=A0A5E7VB51_PSEFL|nr:hypothetical protein BSF44_50340 [Pseudomonas sp. ACN8]VVQ19440.1 hypothetical protein PS938_04727 [Pseudomonas fluorescens]